MAKTKEELREARRLWFAPMEQKLKEVHPNEEDRMFYYHSSEDRIVLSHALFWVMTQLQFFKSKMRKEKFFLLLRQYEEEMLDASFRMTIISQTFCTIATSYMRCYPQY